MSQQAPFVDAATANDPDNFANTFVSYYSYGATLGLALDLELRQRDHTLDEVMQVMWQRYGRPEIPYHVRDIELAVGAVTGDAAFAKTWFAQHIYGSSLPDFTPLFAGYGLSLKPARPDSAGFFGLRLSDRDSVVVVTGLITESSPLYTAGVDMGSELLSLDGQPIRDVADWNAAVASMKLGKSYALKFSQLGINQEGTFVAQASPELVLTVDARPGRKARKRQDEWLSKR